MFWGGRSKKASSKKGTATRTKRARSSKKTKSGKKLNEYFSLMLDAKKNNRPEFVYKGKKYKQFTTKTGLKSYKRA